MEIVNFLLNISGNSHLHEECKSDIWARTRAPCEAFPSRAQQRSHEVQWPAQNHPRRGGLLRSRCSVLGGWACSQPLCAQLGVRSAAAGAAQPGCRLPAGGPLCPLCPLRPLCPQSSFRELALRLLCLTSRPVCGVLIKWS